MVAVLSPPDEDASPYAAAVTHGGGSALILNIDDPFPASAGGLLAIGGSPFTGNPPRALREALERGLPVLGVGWGMHALNVALGGKPPVRVPQQNGAAAKHTVFISPGAKLSYTIAGSGWVAVPFSNTHGIRPAELAPGLLASCYREDGFLAAIEQPGRSWVIGVQWDAHRIAEMPSSFDSLLLALCERAEEQANA
jgi:putative glutamine amidotransferase